MKRYSGLLAAGLMIFAVLACNLSKNSNNSNNSNNKNSNENKATPQPTRRADADVFVSTSHGEGLPVAVLEAMAAGCPVILSDIPPHRELAEEADFIPLVIPGDVEGFAAEIRRYREMPLHARREIGRKCRSHMATRFTVAIMLAGTGAVYREVAPAASSMAREP